MKKKLVLSVATTTLLCASAVLAGGPEIIPQPDYFSGFYAGGTVSVHNMTSEQSSSFVSTTELSQSISFLDELTGITTIVDFAIPPLAGGLPLLAQSEVDGSTVDVYGGIQAGFGKVFAHRFYLGVVGFGEWGKQQATTQNTTSAPYELTVTTLDDIGTVRSESGNATINTSTTTQLTNDYGVAAKLGYLFTPTTLLYGKIGAEWADMKVSTSVNEVASADFNRVVEISATGEPLVSIVGDSDITLSGSSSSTETQAALLLGIGLEQFVYTDIVSLSLEYDYVNFPSVETTGDVTATGTNLTGTLVDNTPAALLGATFSGTPSALPATTLPNALTASGSAKVSKFQAAVNFYFGRDWI